MLKNNISFGAKFVYNQGFDYKKFCTKKNKETVSQIDNFLEFINSDKGKNFLEKMPEKDILELRVYKDDKNIITPKLWHKVWVGDSYGKVCENLDIRK